MITSQIQSAITSQRFEAVRDRIAEILGVELINQAQYESDQVIKSILLSPQIYAERYRPLNESELFAINIFYFDSDFSDKESKTVRGLNTYVIDFIGNSADTNRAPGDQISSNKVQRIAGMVRAILDSPHWRRLGYDSAPFFIERTGVRSIKRTEEENTRDASNIILYRMIFEVQLKEGLDEGTSIAFAANDTEVKLDDTDLGLQYVYEP